ncbi:hypothetical protein [Stenoxybacter acetivorans]|uniref:hypothetical protein n=1 Tax=Stenoxybacter acetivorans TaxID=422441 RepID=UPI0006911D14|nr:hypothetical protein [Stenoxybacter acetivorans]
MKELDYHNFKSKELSTDLFKKPLTLYYYIDTNMQQSSVSTLVAIDNRTIARNIIDKDNYPHGVEAIFFIYSENLSGKIDPIRQDLTLPPEDLNVIDNIFRKYIAEIFIEKNSML